MSIHESNTHLESRSAPDFNLSAIIDAGIETFTIEMTRSVNGRTNFARRVELAANDEIRSILASSGLLAKLDDPDLVRADLFITGKLADSVREALGRGVAIRPAAALWQAGRMLVALPENRQFASIGIVEISASGYSVLCVNRDGSLKDGLLITNPHCGAGTGINLNRVLQKLDIPRDRVDTVLRRYLGPEQRERRNAIAPRADRCGVFSSSATVSDKNQGIPLDFALATTIKSEVLKPCAKVPAGTGRIYLSGGIFRWQYARDCAEDFLTGECGVTAVSYDPEQSLAIDGIRNLIETVGPDSFRKQEGRLRPPRAPEEYPAFASLAEDLGKNGRYHRLAGSPVPTVDASLEDVPVNLALDVGSTMAKLAIGDAGSGEVRFLTALDNHGDTIETIQEMFRHLASFGIDHLSLQHIGITGSGRYQARTVLREVYPHLADRISVLVENYAHARGSIEEAKARIEELSRMGRDVNREEAILVDVGGEDTKISVISLDAGDLRDNAMNIKCSAGTGSLMDTLKTLFGIESIEEACREAYRAEKSYNINATCAVFLMENAGRMRAEGYPTAEILASCYWAIVENMARTLWSQVKLPGSPLLLLHGQTMLSDPLPLAVTSRMEEFMDSETYGLVPDNPGHRACIGLLKSMTQTDETLTAVSPLDDLINRSFTKKIITCRGAVCGDRKSRCNRVKLTFHTADGKSEQVRLGGCSAVNDLCTGADREVKSRITDSYQAVWRMSERQLPKSDRTDRVVIPRSFSASDHAGLLAGILQHLDLPVHVDSVIAGDVTKGRRFFELDACAPIIGATGQLQRLAADAHGMILIPQIDFLPTNGASLGRACTVNQGGAIIAMKFAEQEHPDARFLPFDLSLTRLEPEFIAAQLYHQWQPFLSEHGLTTTTSEFLDAVKAALDLQARQEREAADHVADLLEGAVAEGRDVVIACGRGYVLNPGVYDSHIGRLFRDKGVLAIPSNVLDVELSAEFSYNYWRNPHHISTIIDAVRRKTLHTIVRHERMARVLERIEAGTADSRLGLSLVSTFNCGPDSISLPLIQELTRSIPFVLVQSDGAIKELAHLENRVNTYLKQLTADTQEELGDEEFSMDVLDEFAPDGLDPDTDVLYFPTMGDNRVVTSVLKGAGFTCIDNYDDENYDPEATIALGRKFTGDTICAPFAGGFGDTLLALAKFKALRSSGQLNGKHRLMVFNLKGCGPCRQGQYYDMHRILLHRMKRNERDGDPGGHSMKDVVLRYLIGLESTGFDIGAEEWAIAQSIQGLVLQGVLNDVLFTAGADCRDQRELARFLAEYRAMKQDVFRLQEQGQPSRAARFAVKAAETVDRLAGRVLAAFPFVPPRIAPLAKFFGYGLHRNNGIPARLKTFAEKWIQGDPGNSNRVRIHADGEAYMRVALSEQIFESIIDAIGFRSFTFTSNPLWSYVEYVPQESIQDHEEAIFNKEQELQFKSDPITRQAIKGEIDEHRKGIRSLTSTIQVLRERLAKPLYAAAGLPMPHPIKTAMTRAAELLPTGKPHGDLLPYVGESLEKIDAGTDLILNVAPADCMVATMGGVMHPLVLNHANHPDAQMESILSQNGEVDRETIEFALLKQMGPARYYGC